MPELPEVQTIINDLRIKILLRKIIDIKTITRSIWRYGYPRKGMIIGLTVTDIDRRGKYILIHLSNKNILVVHLGMTGRLTCLPPGSKPAKHTHVLIKFADFELHYNDIRRFGFMDLIGEKDMMVTPYLRALGRDPLEMNQGEFINLIKSKDRMMKPFLLDQHVFSGLGNIYSDEILYLARIHPKTVSSKIGKKKLLNLYNASQEVLTEAIKARGSSIADYVDGSGVRGMYQNSHLVYGREGKPCSRCGAKIRREIIGSRSAHYCPRCQRLY